MPPTYPELAPYFRFARNAALLMGGLGVVVSLLFTLGSANYLEHLIAVIGGAEILDSFDIAPWVMTAIFAAGGLLQYHLAARPLRAAAALLRLSPRRARVTVRFERRHAEGGERVSRWHVDLQPVDPTDSLPSSVVILKPPGSEYRYQGFSEEASVYWDGDPGLMVITTSRGALVATRE